MNASKNRIGERERPLMFVMLVLAAVMLSVGTVSAGPNCDADGDLVLKAHPKCGGDDPNDSDPCVPDPTAEACSSGGGGSGGEIAPDPFNLARASFATRAELAWWEGGVLVEPDGGVFADGVEVCQGFDYWDWQEEFLPDGEGLPCTPYLNSSNVSGGGRWFLISSAAGSDEVVDRVERWLVVDFTKLIEVVDEFGQPVRDEFGEVVRIQDPESPCYDLDSGGTTEDYSQYGIPLYLDGQILEDSRPCVDNVSVRLAADRILKAKSNQQQLEFSIRHRPDPEASIFWSPWGYVSYTNPLYLRAPMTGDPLDWENCRVMSTRPAPGMPHDRAEAELLWKTGAGQTQVLGTYDLPLEVCVKRASD